MKVVGIIGSPRENSNTEILANKVLSTAENLGAEIQVFKLNDMEYKGCQACGKCKTESDYCMQEDDLTPVLKAIHESDAVVMASPVYFGNVSGQFKTFFDRWYSFVGEKFSTRIKPGKHSVFIVAQGAEDPEYFKGIIENYDFFLEHFGFTRHSIRGLGVGEAGSILENDVLMKQAEDIGKKIMNQ